MKGENMNNDKKIVYVDMDNVLVDFPSGIARLTDSERVQFDNNFDECPGIFSRKDPIEGEIDGYKLLSDNFDTYILSTAPWLNSSAWTDKLNWVHKYLGAGKSDPAYKRLKLSHHKHLLMGDFLIDDRTANGAGQFKGTHIHFGTDPKFMDWNSVIEFMKTQM
jgi:5'(3')-deoxyribonucleotidase